MGPDGQARLESRLAEIEHRLRRLEERVGVVDSVSTAEAPGARDEEQAPTGTGGDGLHLSRPLGAVALVCGILVLALLLRTMAEQRWVDRSVGAALGLGYCGVLLAIAWAVARRSRLVSTLLAVTGTLLGQSIVIEGYHRFGALSALAALGALGVLAAAGAFLGRRIGARLVTATAFVGSAFLATVLDLPNMALAGSGAWLCAACGTSYVVGRRERSGWVRWPIQLFSAGLLVAWAAYLRAEGLGERRLAGFGIFLLLHTVLAMGAAAWPVLRRRAPDAFEQSVVVVGPVVALAAGQWAFGGATLAPWGVGAWLLLGVAAVWLGRRPGDERRAAGTWAFAAGTLGIWWVPVLFESPLASASVLAAGALGLFAAAEIAGQRGMRVVAHAMSFAAVIRVVAAGAGGWVVAGGDGAAFAAALVLAVAGLGQYVASRHRAPPERGFLAESDPHDRLGVLPLSGGVAAAFVAVRSAGAMWLDVSGGAGGFTAWQSVVGSLLLAVLLAVAVRRRFSEAVVVALVGLVLLAGKVVLYDLMVLPAGTAMWSVGALTAAAGFVALFLRRGGKAVGGRQ